MAYIATGSPQRLEIAIPTWHLFDVFDTQDKPITVVVVMTSFFLRYARHWSLRNWLLSPTESNILRVHNQAILKNILSGR